MSSLAILSALRAPGASALKNWKAAGLIVLLAFGVGQSLRVLLLKTELQRARAALVDPATRKLWRDEYLVDHRDLEACQANGQVLTAALDRQNTAVASLKTESDTRRTAASAAERQAQVTATAYRNQAQTIAAAKPSGTVCDQADKLILESRDGE